MNWKFWERDTTAQDLVLAKLRIIELENGLMVAKKTLEQIAHTPRNKGAKINANATLLFLEHTLKINVPKPTNNLSTE